MRLVQLWRGHVESVGRGTFVARLETVRGTEPDVTAEIYTRALLPADRAWLAPGCFITWAIGEGRGGGHSWLRLKHGWPRRVMPGPDPVAAMLAALGPLGPPPASGESP